MKRIFGLTVLLLIGAIVMFLGIAIKRETSLPSQDDEWSGDYNT